MKHILLLMLFCLPCSIFALNWFDVCGSTWTVSISSCEPDDPISYSQYSIGESATISGHDCKEYLCNGEMLYYVYTEGEKVYCIRPGAEDEGLLLYDFGLNVGDEITVDIVCRSFNTSFDPHSRQICVGSGIISSCGHTYEYLEMCELYDGETEPNDFSWHGIWIKGLGGTNFLGGEFANWGYDLVGGGARARQPGLGTLPRERPSPADARPARLGNVP